jgi:transposase-like protein
MDLIEIASHYNTEAKCLAYLESARWPEGVRCVRSKDDVACGSAKISKIVTKESKRKNGRIIPARHLYQCLECGLQFTAKSGTLFNDSHLPLTKWFLAVALITNAKKGLSARQLGRDLKIKYQTAWHLYHRIREALMGGSSLFTGTVEMDEVYVGGRYDERRQRAKYDKAPVVGVLQRGTKEQPSQVHAQHVQHVHKPVIHQIVNERVSFDARVFTDEGAVYRQLAQTRSHEIVVHSKNEYVRGEVHTNSIEGFWSLVKRQIIGQHHWVSVKHLQSYLNERVFMFNNRKAEDLFRLVVIALAIGIPLPYAILTAELEFGAEPDPASPAS